MSNINQLKEFCSKYLNKSTKVIEYSLTNQTSFHPIENQTNVFMNLNTDPAENNQTSIEFFAKIKHLIDEFCFDVEIKTNDSIKKNLIKYTYPFIVLLGLLGNLMSFLVMTRIYKRKKNFQKFALSLAALSLADLSVLIFGCSREYLDIVFNMSIQSSNIYACKLIFFTCYLSSSFSAYLHAFIACERWIAISSPIKSKSIYTFTMNKILMCLVFIICILINLPLLYFASINTNLIPDAESGIGVREKKECELTKNYFDQFSIVLTSIDTVFYCLIPFLITVLFSSLTLLKLIRSQKFIDNKTNESVRRLSNLTMNFESSDSEKKVNKIVFAKRAESLSSKKTYLLNDQNSQLNKNKKKKSSNLKITIMLMALPICYLITTFPIFVFMIQGFFIKRSPNIIYLNAAYCVGTILMYVNNSINILFYIVLGKNLRNDFLAVLPVNYCLKSNKLLLREQTFITRLYFRRKTSENIFN